MKTIMRLQALLCCVALTMAAFSLPAVAKDQVKSKHPSVSYLYMLHADKGDIVKQGSHYRFYVQKPKVVYFSDRPVRESGTLTAKQFMGIWNHGDNSFASNNPNAYVTAAVSLHRDQNNRVTPSINGVYALSQAQLNDQGKLSFQLNAFPGQSIDLKPGPVVDALLFVDNGDNCQGAITPGCY